MCPFMNGLYGYFVVVINLRKCVFVGINVNVMWGLFEGFKNYFAIIGWKCAKRDKLKLKSFFSTIPKTNLFISTLKTYFF